MKNEQLLHEFTVTNVLSCTAFPGKLRAMASLSDDVSPVFPYLNSAVPKVVYSPEANSLTVKHSWRILTVYPRAAIVAKIEGAEEAVQALTWFQALCNDTWQHRDEITPCHERRKLTDPIDVYELLPRLNCKECGQPTCWAFAFELLFGEQKLTACPHISKPEYQEAGRRLAELVG